MTKMTTPGKMKIDTEATSGGNHSQDPGTGHNTAHFTLEHLQDIIRKMEISGFNPRFPNSPSASEASFNEMTGQTRQTSKSVPITPMRTRAHTLGQAGGQGYNSMLSPASHRRLTSANFIYGSPVHGRFQSPENGSGQYPRHGSIFNHGSVSSYSPDSASDFRDSDIDSGASYGMPSRRATLAGAQQPVMLHPQIATQQTMHGINEQLAVAEFGFRRGQLDRGTGRTRLPSNPFESVFDDVWAVNYMRGRESNTASTEVPGDPTSPSHENYSWPILVNPMTQTPEHPNGSYDPRWARDRLVSALTGMRGLVSLVVQRGKDSQQGKDRQRGMHWRSQGDWQRIVCDIPTPMVAVLPEFPDLQDWYDQLKRDATEALAGGLPEGY